MTTFHIYEGDALQILDALAPASVDIIFTSPNPVFYAHDYNKNIKEGLGTEENNLKYANNLLGIFSKLRRVLKETGSFWLQMGDYHYANNGSMMFMPEQIALQLVYKERWLCKNKLFWHRIDDSPM